MDGPACLHRDHQNHSIAHPTLGTAGVGHYLGDVTDSPNITLTTLHDVRAAFSPPSVVANKYLLLFYFIKMLSNCLLFTFKQFQMKLA